MKQKYDDCFYVEQSRWKTWTSYDEDGNKLVTSYTEVDCVNATRFFLKRKQEGSMEDATVYDGFVSGKL